MITFNPIKAFNSFVFDAPQDFDTLPSLDQAPDIDKTSDNVVNHFWQNVDPTYRGRAIVSATITPRTRGRVHFQGSWWPALCEQDVTLAVGEVVQVVGRQNITLLVRSA